VNKSGDFFATNIAVPDVQNKTLGQVIDLDRRNEMRGTARATFH
jgi:hypothetical protein